MRRLCLTHTYVQKVDNENNSVRTYMGKESNEDEIQGFPGGKLQPLRRVKDSAYQCRRHKGPGSIPWLGFPLEEEMASHSSILAWKIPWTEERGGLQPTGSQSQTQLSAHTEDTSVCITESCRWTP